MPGSTTTMLYHADYLRQLKSAYRHLRLTEVGEYLGRNAHEIREVLGRSRFVDRLLVYSLSVVSAEEVAQTFIRGSVLDAAAASLLAYVAYAKYSWLKKNQKHLGIRNL